MSRPNAALLGLVLTAACVQVAGCEAHSGTLVVPALTEPPPDGGTGPDIPDGAVLCSDPSVCDDGIDCTRDLCVEGGYCVNATASSRCSDGVFCNGVERCDKQLGCRPSGPPRCDDDDVCTLDSCDEDGKRCEHAPRDFDGDGEGDFHCVGGTDCDDFDVTRGASAPEACGDGTDNDCDDAIDESECGLVEHDTCDDALDISEGGVFVVALQGARHDYALGCGRDNGRDVAFELTLDEPRDVTLIARGTLASGGDEIATLEVRDDCSDDRTSLGCDRGFPAEVRMRSLAAGTHRVIAHAESASELRLDARFDEASEAPGHDTCAGARDVGEGGHFQGSFVDVADDLELSCGFDGAADLIYAVTLDEPRDLELAAVSATGERMALSVRSDCEDASSSLRCLSDAPVQGVLRSLPAGTYFIAVEGPASREVDFDLDVAVMPATQAPEGEGCEHAIDLALGEEIEGSFTGRQDVLDVRCECPDCGLFLRDVVYRVELPERMDLGIELEGVDARMHYALLDDCAAPDMPLECGDGRPVDDRLRDLAPGTRFLVVESLGAAGFTLRARQRPLTVPVEVSDNAVCELATEVPIEGGVFVGDTRGANDDYGATCGGRAMSADSVFHVHLDAPAHVRATVIADFDTVMYRFEGDGVDACESFSERTCDDDSGGGTNSRLDEDLGAGEHFLVVDGFSFGNEGQYLLDVAITR